jgi:formyl-CoA transferase
VVLYVSGFGQSGPYRDRPGFGTLIEAMSGYADLTGQQDGPPTLPQFALADSVAALYGAFGVMNALYWRDAGGGGVGQAIDLSLLEPLTSILGPLPIFHEQLGLTLTRMGSRNWANAPRNVYQAGDGKWIAIAASVQQIAARCFAAVGRPELIEDPRFATAARRLENVDEVDEIIGAWVGARSSDEALKVMLEHDVAAAPVMDVAALMADPHVRARGMFTQVADPDLGPVSMQSVIPALSRTPGKIAWGGPRPGQHNAEVYSSLLSLTEADLQALRDEHVI